jgi:predicted nuclease of predicted toxin-antitoxin system
MRFLIDMPLSPQLAAWLRENGHEADHASTVGLHGAGTAIIAVARHQNRIIITALPLTLIFPSSLP